MEWTDVKILTFIEEYRKRPVLWDSTNHLSKHKTWKDQAWTEIIQVMQLHCSILELKRKMTCLLASFRRERQKLRKKELENKPFESTWFAFKSFTFLIDKYNQSRYNQQIQMFETQLIEDEIKVKTEPEETTSIETKINDLSFLNEHFEGQEMPEGEFVAGEEVDQSEALSSNIVVPLKKSTSRKRKLSEVDEDTPEEECSKLMGTRDRFDAFGDYIACHLRELDKRPCAYVMKKINDLLFDIDMGKKFKK